MENQPLVSVVITTYNRASYLERAVRSVLGQTYKNMELIVVDDCSVDETPKILKELSVKNRQVIFFSNSVNIGTVESANRGIKKAKGKYIARLDDDDYWCDPQKLEKQVGFLEKNPEYGLVGGGMIKVNESGKEIARLIFPESDEDIRKVILVSNVFVHSTVVFRKDIFEKIGGYDKAFSFGFEDIELWLRLGNHGRFYNLREFFTYYLDREFSKSGSAFRSEKFRRMAFLKINMIRKYKNMYPGYKTAYFLCWLNYAYSFLPFKGRLQPMIYAIKGVLNKTYSS